MDVHSEYGPTTSALSFGHLNFSTAEDSGYHTPGSANSEVSNGILDTSVRINTSCFTGQIQFCDINKWNHYSRSTYKDSLTITPPARRGLKRVYQETEASNLVYSASFPTPTSLIAGKIQSLKVKENKENVQSQSSINSKQDNESTLSYPTTPEKNNCKLYPCRKSRSKHLIHSLSCDTQILQPRSNSRLQDIINKCNTRTQSSPVDILQMLLQNNVILPLERIFNYLTNEDIDKLRLVSTSWCNIWDYASTKAQKQKYNRHLKSIRSNQENEKIGPKKNFTQQKSLLRDVQNEFYSQLDSIKSHSSPPVSPSTNRFKKFTKAALLDERLQLSCVRCGLPAKVTEENTGEDWVECTSLSCSYQYCKHCKCKRHPGKVCIQYNYDLNQPSPSKRLKNKCAPGTRKSKKNLRRLLI